MAKPIFKVRNAKLIRVGDLWPHLEHTEKADRMVMYCQADEKSTLRDTEPGDPLRTSLIESISEDRTKVETMNSIYEVSNWEE